MDVKKILWPTDFSSISEKALPHVKSLTAQYGAEIHVIYVIEDIAHRRGAVPNLRAAGADKVVETQEISGLRIWDIITRPVVTAILDKTLFGQANLNVAEVPVPEGSSLVGKPVPELNLEQHYNLILLGVVDRLQRQHFVYSQETRDSRLEPGDILMLIGPADAIGDLQRDLAAGCAGQP